MTTTNLTGALVDTQGNALAETDYAIIPAAKLIGVGANAVVGQSISGTTAATTALIAPVTLYKGDYFLRYPVNGVVHNAPLRLWLDDQTLAEGLAGASVGAPDFALPRWITRTRIVTSGAASYQWDDIPASATALRVTFGDHSLGAGGGDLFVRLGIASGIEATGYDAVSGTTAYTTAFVAPEGNANRRFTGALELDLVDPATNTWAGKFNGVLSVPSVMNGGGSKALAGPLTTVQIVASAGTHDNGHAVLSYLAVA